MKSCCVILTHRHGACVALVLKENKWMQKDFIKNAQKYAMEKSELVQMHENFEFISDKHSFIFARALGKTAENLSNLFEFCGTHFESLNSKKFDLILGTGPGSFTGLRLGCAFANGLNFGNNAPQKLFSVSTPLITDLLVKFGSNQELINSFFQELGEYHKNDPASGYVTFFDLFYIFQQILENKIAACSNFMPVYSKTTAPVLNLRKE